MLCQNKKKDRTTPFINKYDNLIDFINTILTDEILEII